MINAVFAAGAVLLPVPAIAPETPWIVRIHAVVVRWSWVAVAACQVRVVAIINAVPLL